MNARRLSTAFHAAVAAVALLTIAAPARADDPIDPTASCSESRAADTSYNPSYVACVQNYTGVAAPQGTIDPFPGYGPFKFVGQTTNDNSGTGPFEAFGPGLKFGTLTLDTPLDKPFVVALASQASFEDPSKTNYSLYLFAPGLGETLSSIAFSTRGTTNLLGGPFELAYANLYTLVPEPSTYALFLAGLGVTALALRRRKTA